MGNQFVKSVHHCASLTVIALVERNLLNESGKKYESSLADISTYVENRNNTYW